MKCPSCGYNSFDYLTSCAGCTVDLTEHKSKHSLVSPFPDPISAESLSLICGGPTGPAAHQAEVREEDLPEADIVEEADTEEVAVDFSEFTDLESDAVSVEQSPDVATEPMKRHEDGSFVFELEIDE